MTLQLLAYGIVATGGAVMAAGLVVAVLRDHGQPANPGWTAESLAAATGKIPAIDGTWPTPGSQPRCDRCRARHCQPCRTGADCGAQRAPSLTTTLGGTGLHEPAAVLRRVVA